MEKHQGLNTAVMPLMGATQERKSEKTHEVREGWHQPGGQAKRNRLRRMLGCGRMVVASSQMRRMRSHRLL